MADEITAMAVVALRGLDLLTTPTEVLLGGGVLTARNSLLTTLIEQRLADQAPQAKPLIASIPPIVGAALLGLDRLRATETAKIRLRAHWPEGLLPTTEPPPLLLPEVGAERATRWLASARREQGSTLGGMPDWLQDPQYLDCPACGAAMDYIGLVGGADIGWGEGADYLFLHAGCGVAAICRQQT